MDSVKTTISVYIITCVYKLHVSTDVHGAGTTTGIFYTEKNRCSNGKIKGIGRLNKKRKMEFSQVH